MLSSSYTGENLVFVVGSPRSGTTWVQRLLAAHPDVSTGQESDVFDLYLGPQLRTWRSELDHGTDGRGGVGLACYLEEDRFLSALRSYMLALLEPMVGSLGPGKIFVEKTPSHVVYLPEIAELLPESRVVNVTRDARDVVASLLAASRSWGRDWAPRHPRDAARMWVDHVEAAERGRGLFGERLLDVRYEHLHRDPAGELKRLLRFLNLESTDAAVAEAIERTSPASEGTTPALPREGEFTRRGQTVTAEPVGFVRQARVGTWHRDLTSAEKVATWRVARHAMARNGYVWRRPW